MGEDDTNRRGYHHGNLRAALADAAVDLIAEKGPQGFTMAEAARAAGVSPAAPYRHFKDRDALVAEVARDGFERFADRLERAWAGGQPTPLTAFEAVGRAYLAFARDESARFAAMFRGPVSEEETALRVAADRAFGVLLSASAALSAHLPADRRPPPHMVGYHVWAFSHGIAALFDGDGPRRTPISADDLLESGLGIYLRGLGVLRSDD
ncbi:MAG: TetR/AcrR family transcriptional regulator [Pseudomonadota bacterium]